jgi:hypothetical protein
MIRHAFKEWAVICRGLAEGRQALILRKGGIAEEGGVFKPEHARFWLYPTFVHQQEDGIKAEAASLLQAADWDRPDPEILRLAYFAEVSGTFLVRNLEVALAINDLHLWSEETVRKRFAYREPGLYVLAVRVYRLRAPLILPLRPEYDGCKTWVEFDRELPTDGAIPAIDGRRYADFLEDLDRRLHPVMNT